MNKHTLYILFCVGKCSLVTRPLLCFQPVGLRPLRYLRCPPLPLKRWAADRASPRLTPSPPDRRTEQAPVSVTLTLQHTYCTGTSYISGSQPTVSGQMGWPEHILIAIQLMVVDVCSQHCQTPAAGCPRRHLPLPSLCPC